MTIRGGTGKQKSKNNINVPMFRNVNLISKWGGGNFEDPHRKKKLNFVPSLEDINQRSQKTIHETTINSLLLTFARVTLNSEGMFFSQKQPLYYVQAKGQKTLSGRQ